MQDRLCVCGSHSCSIWLPFLVFMLIPIVTNAPNNSNGNAVHGTSCLHFQANYIVFVPQLIPFPGILYQFLPRPYRSIPYSRALGVCSPFTFHEVLNAVIVKLIKPVLLLPRIHECAISMLFMFY